MVHNNKILGEDLSPVESAKIEERLHTKTPITDSISTLVIYLFILFIFVMQQFFIYIQYITLKILK